MSLTTMSSTTICSPSYGTLPREAVPKRKSLFQRLFDRMIEARMRKAEEFIRQNRHLIPRELEEQAAWKISPRSEDSLPFLR